jgi:hypothetical protein
MSYTGLSIIHGNGEKWYGYLKTMAMEIFTIYVCCIQPQNSVCYWLLSSKMIISNRRDKLFFSNRLAVENKK